MNIRRSIIGAVLAGASVVGVVSMASSAARAETPTTATATTEHEVGATAQSTRRFWIENLSSTTLIVADRWSADQAKDPLLPDDSVPDWGTEIRPGEHITVEVVSQWASHVVTVELLPVVRDKGRVTVDMAVIGNMRLAFGYSSDLKVDTYDGNITIRDK